jgi:phospholipid/cholesterol/gamma-HCH transport system permease protein
MIMLLGRSVSRGCRPPFDWGPEFTVELRHAMRVSLLPLILTAFALSFGPAGIQASDFLGLLGAIDRLGSIYVLVVVREIAPLVTGIVLAGAVGTAICADLGAREVREELDALRVQGVDIARSLVFPRLLVIALLAVMFDVLALLAGMLGAVLVVLQNHGSLGAFFATFFSNGTTLEFGAALLKSAIFGVMIGMVACHRGITASGGAEGVGRAVNRTVVTAFLLIGSIDYVFTQYLLATNPILSAPR